MYDFIMAALPWVVMGLCVAIISVSSVRTNKKKGDGKSVEKNYKTDFMAVGMCIGCALSICFKWNTGVGMAIGMLFGLAIGMAFNKKSK